MTPYSLYKSCRSVPMADPSFTYVDGEAKELSLYVKDYKPQEITPREADTRAESDEKPPKQTIKNNNILTNLSKAGLVLANLDALFSITGYVQTPPPSGRQETLSYIEIGDTVEDYVKTRFKKYKKNEVNGLKEVPKESVNFVYADAITPDKVFEALKVALRWLSPEGSFVVSVNNIDSNVVHNAIYTIAQCFTTFWLLKPLAIDQDTTVDYIVAKGPLPSGKIAKSVLEYPFVEYDDLPKKFLRYIRRYVPIKQRRYDTYVKDDGKKVLSRHATYYYWKLWAIWNIASVEMPLVTVKQRVPEGFTKLEQKKTPSWENAFWLKFKNLAIRFNKYNKPDTLDLVAARSEAIAQMVAVVQRYVKIGEAENVVYRWIFTQKLVDRNNTDAILPTTGGLNGGLRRYLTKYSEEEILEIEKNLIETCLVAIEGVTDSTNVPKARRLEVKQVKKGIRFSYPNGPEYLISSERYDRLVELYGNNNDDADNADINIYTLLLRYNGIVNPGYNGTLPKPVFDYLVAELQVEHELFASPLNATLDNYNSLFKDTDGPFGSVGNVFSKGVFERLTEGGGSFEANPPFIEEYMVLTSNLVIDALERITRALSFVVVYPTWSDMEAYKMLERSNYTVLTLKLKKGEHYYLAGDQYAKASEDLHLAQFNSTVFILQNAKGQKKYSGSSGMQKRLKKLFGKE